MSDPTYTDEQIKAMKRNRYLSACFGKTSFESRAVAEAVARRRRSKSKNNQSYKCTGCGKYHIGNPPA